MSYRYSSVMSNSRKLNLLYLGIGLLALLSYQLAVRNTLELASMSQDLESELLIGSVSPRQQAQLKQQIAGYSKYLADLNLSNTSFQNNLLRHLNISSKEFGSTVTEFNQTHEFSVDQNTFLTYSFSLRGSYTEILKTIHALENQRSFGEIVHIDYEKKKDYRNRTTYLEAKVMVQQIR